MMCTVARRFDRVARNWQALMRACNLSHGVGSEGGRRQQVRSMRRGGMMRDSESWSRSGERGDRKVGERWATVSAVEGRRLRLVLGQLQVTLLWCVGPGTRGGWRR